MPQLTVPLPLEVVLPIPLPSPCIHCHALQLAWLASRWAVYHLQRELSTRISQSPLALFTCLICLALPPFLSVCLSLSVQLSAKFIKNKLALGTVLVWLPNSLAVCKQLVSLLSFCFFAAISRRFMPHFREVNFGNRRK